LRYKDIRTYSYNSVQIEEQGHEYINASWIHLPFYRKFIATQGPIPKTIEDFWIMCNKYNVDTIVMLCNFKEKNVEKCANYIASRKMKFFQVKNMKSQNIDNGITIRRFQLFNFYEITKINNMTQIHLTCWEDHSALNSNYFDKIIKIIKIIDQISNDKTVVVHCSAGVGRTGTFISLYNLYHEIMKQINDKDKEIIKFSVFNLVRKIKELRMYMVENQNQYILLYKFVNYLLVNNNN
jgi:protein tyrosine phosphatase